MKTLLTSPGSGSGSSSLVRKEPFSRVWTILRLDEANIPRSIIHEETRESYRNEKKYNILMPRGKDQSEVLFELARELLKGGSEGTESIKRVSVATQLSLIASTYKMISQVEDLSKIAEKVLEKLQSEETINKMSPRSLVEAAKAISEIMNKYASLASSLGKDVDIPSVEAGLLEVLANIKEDDPYDIQGSSKKEIVEKILEIARSKAPN
ncbi:hypothetical protein phiLo_78 [Thermus phage phiLo]|nr:hypothetical protein phiLo_78 [Thermus phage phiLo]